MVRQGGKATPTPARLAFFCASGHKRSNAANTRALSCFDMLYIPRHICLPSLFRAYTWVVIIFNPLRLNRLTYSALLVVPTASSSSRRVCGRNISAANNRRSYGQAMRIGVLLVLTFITAASVMGAAFFLFIMPLCRLLWFCRYPAIGKLPHILGIPHGHTRPILNRRLDAPLFYIQPPS